MIDNIRMSVLCACYISLALSFTHLIRGLLFIGFKGCSITFHVKQKTLTKKKKNPFPH